MSLDRITCLVLVSLTLGCLEAPPEYDGSGGDLVDVDMTNGDLGASDVGTLPGDLGVDPPVTRDSGQVDDLDAGIDSDSGIDAGPVATIDGTAEIGRLGGLFTFDGTIAAQSGTMEFYSVAVVYESEPPIPQGSLALNLESTFIAETNDSFPDLTGTLVVGSWVRDRTTRATSTWISQGKSDGTDGWSIGRSGDEFGCTLRNGTMTKFVGVPAANFNAWNHVVCTFELINNVVKMQALVNGVASATGELEYAATNELFRVGAWLDDSGFRGDIDELFVTTQPSLLVANQRKIWACGTNGLSCRCLASAPAMYHDCGRASDCSGLSACAETTAN